MSRKVNQGGGHRAPADPRQPFDAAAAVVASSPGGAPGIEAAPDPQMMPFSGVAPGTPTASVVKPPRADIPPPKKYRVTRGARILWGGAFVDIRTGKEFMEGTYDIGDLARRGILCEDITPKPPLAEAKTEPPEEQQENAE